MPVKKGNIPWNKGKRGLQKHSETTRKYLGEILKKVGEKTRFQKGISISPKTQFKKGSSGFNRNHTLESRKKMSESKKQKPVRYWRGKEKPFMKGDKNHNWKGGISPIYKKFRQNIQYYDWRRKVFERDKFTCRICFAKGFMNAHHIKPFRDNPDLRVHIMNGITVCQQCHKVMHKREYLFIEFLQGILENGFNSVELSYQETTPSQQERLRKALWACVTASSE